ncbi:MFS transporter [Candidatus Parcubacteria bacterium]|nr:MFS transporter [Candidatus Parcubacteria bacterium]
MDQKSKFKIKILGIASFLNDLGSDMIYPVWPLFVKTLGAPMSILGFLDGLGDALVSISQAISGYISDKIQKRKIFVWLGYLMGGISRIGYSISRNWLHLIPFRILDRAGKIRSAPRDAIIADASTDQDRGANFGFLRMMDNLGAVFGILICIALVDILGFQKLFLLASIPSLIGVILVLLFIKEEKKDSTKIFKGISFKSFSPKFRYFLFLSAIFSLASFSYSFLLIFAKEFGFKVGFVPILYLIFTAMASLSSIPFGKLSDKIGRKKVLEISFLFWLASLGMFLVHKNFWFIIFAFLFYGLHKGALEPSQRALVSELVEPEIRASALGGFQMINGLFSLPASLLAGILWDKISIFAPFYFSFCLTLFSLILLFKMK